MHLKRTILVAILALASCSADELLKKRGPMPGGFGPPQQPQQQSQPMMQQAGQHHAPQQHHAPKQMQQSLPPGPAPPAPRAPERQSRGFDFLAPFRGIFGGRPRGPPAHGPAPAGPASAASQHYHGGKHYGVKPAASEHTNKPHQPHHQQQQPGQHFGGPQDFGQDGFRAPAGFSGPNFPEYAPFNDDYNQQGPQGAPSSHGPTPHHGPPSYPPQHGKSQYGKRPHPPAGPPRGPPQHPPHHGPPHGGPPKFGGPQPHGPPHAAQQYTYHTYAKPQMKHHHYHSFMNPEGARMEGQPQNYYPGEQNQHQNHQQGPAYDGQPAQQHQVPSYSQPGDGNNDNFGPQDASFAPQGFQDFGGFGPAQAQGSQANANGFFGGPENYPEQYEDQTRNTREPQIITAGAYENPQGPYPQGGFSGEYFPSSTSTPDGLPSSSPRPFFPEPPSSTPAAFNAQASGPIIKSHPLRSTAHGGPPPSGPPAGPGSFDEESRREPFLYRPVSSSIQVPGAVDEDAVYGKPMMMDASTVTKRPVRVKKVKSNHQTSSSKQRPVYMPYSNARPTIAPYNKPSEDILPLESPRDPHYIKSSVDDSDTAASGQHGHGHHGIESSNGDRILYHVAGHEGPRSYRFGYDTGKGYNRMFRFEEKDGKGYVTGKYGFYDKHGKLNVVKYEAHPEHGYHAEREHGHHHQTHHIKH